MFIKICGVKEPKHIELIDRLGGTAFGVIVGVPESPRNISIKHARMLIEEKPKGIKSVLVTKQSSMDKLQKLDNEINPDLIQNYYKDSCFLSEIGKLNKDTQGKYIIPIQKPNASREGHLKFQEIIPQGVRYLIYDNSHGTGDKLDCTAAKQIKDKYNQYDIIFAGGLNINNVKEFVKFVNPFGIDLSSGVEASKGEKSPKLISSFFQAINQEK